MPEFPKRKPRVKGQPADYHILDRRTARSVKRSILRDNLGRWDGKPKPPAPQTKDKE